ncbi:uncharacterized protein LOC135839639 [Planococcus citri]|uniref:uncharacterized protein LOC135839639 n=1 Tax=Planococcus citri TaxID=170843 RepID=UPI0031F9121D
MARGNGTGAQAQPQPTPAQWIEIDRAYLTPNFTVRQFQSHELLKGSNNFKDWDNMVSLELRAANLYPFIESQCGMMINISPSRRVMCDAQVVQYLRASVIFPISKRINHILNAYDTYEELKKLFSQNDFHDYVDLHNRMNYLKYRITYNVDRFIADFDRLIEDFRSIGTNFPEKYVCSLFLSKIEGCKEPRSPFFSFYSTITSLPGDIATLDYIKQKFQNTAKTLSASLPNKSITNTNSSSAKRKQEDLKPEENTVSVKRAKSIPEKNSINSTANGKPSKPLHEKYTPTQLEQLAKMSKEEKKNVQCRKCSDYFHTHTECPNPGRLCFKCYTYGHEKSACKLNKGG